MAASISITGCKPTRLPGAFVKNVAVVQDTDFKYSQIPQRKPSACVATYRWASTMKSHDIELMSLDELSCLHDRVTSVLVRKISAEKTRLDDRLRKLNRSAPEIGKNQKMNRVRRPYPQVFPRYRNPAAPSETWSGRGKRPRWLTAQLHSGKKLDDFRIQPSPHHSAATRSGGRSNGRRRAAAPTQNAILAE